MATEERNASAAGGTDRASGPPGPSGHPEAVVVRMDELVAFNRTLGTARRLEGVGWSRIIEYAYAADGLRPGPGRTLLDLGTGRHSIFPLYCAAVCGAEAVMTDLTEAVRAQERLLRRVGEAASRLRIEIQDATRLSHPHESFDLVSAISAVEHIPDEGDSAAVREAHRVLRPGGRLALTVPFSPLGHRDVLRRRGAYDREFGGKPVFFQREYDAGSLARRLLDAAPFEVEGVRLLGEGEAGRTPIANWNRRMPLRNLFKYVWGWRLTALARRSFRPLAPGEERHATIAVAVMRKG